MKLIETKVLSEVDSYGANEGDIGERYTIWKVKDEDIYIKYYWLTDSYGAEDKVVISFVKPVEKTYTDYVEI